MMRKINYSDPKVQELVITLENLGFSFEKTKDSIEVVVDRASRKTLGHELSLLNGIYKTPPLVTQFEESTSIVSLFDQRM